MIKYILIFTIVILFVTLILYTRNYEKKSFNKGVCPTCNIKWRNFDVASDMSRGYCCDRCGDYIWISYNIDTEFLQQEYNEKKKKNIKKYNKKEEI